MNDHTICAYGALYVDTGEDYATVEKQINTFRNTKGVKFIFFDVVYGEGQAAVALAHRAQIIADLQEAFTELPLAAQYVALAPGEDERPARDFMTQFVKEQVK